MLHFIIYTIIVYLLKPFTRSYVNTPRLIASIVMFIIDITIVYKADSTFLKIISSLFGVLFLCNIIRRFIYMILQIGWLKCNEAMDSYNEVVAVQHLCKLIQRYCNSQWYKNTLPETLLQLYEENYEKLHSQMGNAILNAIENFSAGKISKKTLINICKKTTKQIHKSLFGGKCTPQYFSDTIPDTKEDMIYDNRC